MRPAPPARVRRGPWREATYAALDFETTGLDLRRDSIVSFGVVPVIDGRVSMKGSLHQLVAPDVAPSPRSQTIHELRSQDLHGAPPLEEVRPLLAAGLAGRFVLAWFAEVEMRFLARTFGGSARSWARRTIDVRNLAIAVAGEPRRARSEPGFALAGTARRYGVPVADPHEAFDDALVTAQLFLVLASRLRADREPTLREVAKAGRP